MTAEFKGHIYRKHPDYPGITFGISLEGILFRMKYSRREYLVTWDQLFGIAGLAALPCNTETINDAKLAVWKVLGFIPNGNTVL